MSAGPSGAAPANLLRGEVPLALADSRALRLRPSFGRLVAAEQELGSLVRLVERAAEGEVRLDAVVGLLWHCQDAETHRPRFEADCLAAGLRLLLPAYRAVLAQAFAGTAE